MSSGLRRCLLFPWKRDVLLLTIGISLVLWILNSLGTFQWLELLFFDQLMRHRPLEPKDPYITIVGITENDIQQENQWPIADAVLAKALRNLKAHNPRIIGLDLYRDIPIKNGSEELAIVLSTTPNLIAVEKRLGIPIKAPDSIPESQVGFIDFILDPDGVLRRGLLSVESRQGFSTLVALRYLQKENIGLVPVEPSNPQQPFNLGKAHIRRLQPQSGAYTQIDASGYQVLVNFRGKGCVPLDVPQTCPTFRLYSFEDLLQDRIPSADLTDQLVLIGAIAPSLQDIFQTPYSQIDSNQTSGIEIHANIASQIIHTAQGNRPLIRPLPLPEAWEFFWLLGWTALATILGTQYLRYHFLTLGFIPVLILALIYISFWLFLQGYWVPTILPFIAIVLGSFLSQRRILWVNLQKSYAELATYATTLEAQVSDRTRSLAQEMEKHQATAAALQQANQRLQKLAMLDGLTQVANRRGFDDYLLQEWKRSQREKQWLSLVICDIDHFKAYNDTYGHPAGDRCIQELAQIFQDALNRPADLVARYGGEEFALILPHTEPSGAAELVQQIQDMVRKRCLPHRESPTASYITISFGISGLIPSSRFSPDFLIFQADQALYAAKTSGRDRFVMADLPTPPLL
ncbi:MAG: CHASE2 domain-containing protein [Prochlorotrichaceae cyanobacterium]|jgi:diguanylate cyclase (GGDEF)-like protein